MDKIDRYIQTGIATELLAPAGNYESAVAAIDCGADAVYMGGARFGARAAAGNSAEDIARTVGYAHRYGVRVYATLNTLLFDSELDAAEAQAHSLAAAGVDALIVQDMALRMMPLDLPLHASTQMCNMTPEHVRFLQECGFSRVILERALSLKEIRAIRAATDIPIECFVHGAICVGYSGRCFLSRSMSERSGNRGSCSQPCRLTYDLEDASGRVLRRGEHLLSLRDMNLSARIGDLLDAGVTSFKIEGRLKDATYIKNIVSYYRATIDREMAHRGGFRRASAGHTITDFEPAPEKSFSRGYTEYMFDGVRRDVASFDTPKSKGEYIGRVEHCDARSFTLDRRHDLAPGDGICFGGNGTNINRIEGARIIPNRMEGIKRGTAVYRNLDLRFVQRVASSRARRVIDVEAKAVLRPESIVLTFTDETGCSVEIATKGMFEAANNPSANAESLRRQLSRSGDTIFAVTHIGIEGDRFVPASTAARLRREGLEALLDKRLSAMPRLEAKKDDGAALLPLRRVTCYDNVTNSLAERFYRLHGAESIERGLESERSMRGRRVMQSSYCLRRETGLCLREHPESNGDLYLRHGAFRYKLEFDCKSCRMNLIDESNGK